MRQSTNKAKQQQKRPLVTAWNPKSMTSEAYRSLRTNLQYSMIDQKIHTMMVTSSGPGEGKSTTAANLAVTYAQSGQKVLLVDGDLRRPTVHYTFQLSNAWGLSHVLSQQSTWKKVVQRSEVEHLDIMTSGQIPPNPAEMLASKRLDALIDELKSTYEIIIFDSPPALALTDAQLLAAKCDGTLLVIESGRMKRDVVLKVKENLEHVKARILGVVLNNVKKNGKDQYYYYYESS